jgi:hypothetical protein
MLNIAKYVKYRHLNSKGLLHKEDGPALEHIDGSKFWYINGKLHREDGPAVEYIEGDKFWYKHGKYHREDGPALEYANGTKHWTLEGIWYNENDFLNKINNKKIISCKCCNQTNEYAKPNQSDGSYICYNCR